MMFDDFNKYVIRCALCEEFKRLENFKNYPPNGPYICNECKAAINFAKILMKERMAAT